MGSFTGILMTEAKFEPEELKASLPSWVEEERGIAIALLRVNMIYLATLRRLPFLICSVCCNYRMQNYGKISPKVATASKNSPSVVASKISIFQQVLLVQALRPDRLYSASALFASRVLGLKELFSQAVNLKNLLKTTSNLEPILIIISAGVDPSQELSELASSTIGAENYVQVSMGQGQIEVANENLKICATEGRWLCSSWNKKKHAKDIRFLTPSYLSKAGNILRARTLFVLSFFHAVLQERRTYIPQGWTKFYEFSSADLRVASEVIDRICLNSDQKIQWEYVQGLFETTVYGGRIDVLFDSRLSVPTSVDYKEHLQVIRSLPDTDSPSLFGLPENIERSAQCTSSRKMIDQLKRLLRPIEIADKFDVHRWNVELSPILVLWKKLNQGSQIIHLQLTAPQFNQMAEEPPIISFIRLEYYSGVRLVQSIHASLASISKVIRGAILLTDEIHTLATSLLKHETPSLWQKKWEGPEDPLSYLRGAMRRALAVQTWLPKAESGQLLEESLDLSHLFILTLF
ncbi:cytoplasmic dynein 2 heavy chain 1 [Caerostris extrusa]|uniref:Cytoplasmic dynein 2 heavy chain 1 n=1 Tax=Caerostris extrusa TaxID=172846 RepID=A0AAV4XHB6_CAEEX|nr:cytoplasmic dynein 2 heavy chain 1 [Caerostris extrusa]